jgi:hypothetical protein
MCRCLGAAAIWQAGPDHHHSPALIEVFQLQHAPISEPREFRTPPVTRIILFHPL